MGAAGWRKCAATVRIKSAGLAAGLAARGAMSPSVTTSVTPPSRGRLWVRAQPGGTAALGHIFCGRRVRGCALGALYKLPERLLL